jgi:PAS domain S-box-containing protein
MLRSHPEILSPAGLLAASALVAPLGAWWWRRRPDGESGTIRVLAAAMEQSRSAVLILDRQGRITYANRGSCAQTGYAQDELLARTWGDLEVPRLVGESPAGRIRAGQAWEGEWFNRRKDGSVYPVHGGITPVRSEAADGDLMVAVFEDRSEAKAREAELREARDQAQVGDRAKGHFLATMSHEVRTPLNGIVGFTSLLLETPLTPEQREYVQTIRMSTEALIQLTGDILDFARIESGKMKLDAHACDPRECVEDALDLHAARAADKGIELLHRFSADLPAAVETDGGRLRQVLVNLIGNAVKFTERGEIEVAVRRLPPDSAEVLASGRADTCLVEFSIRDTGIGIAEENLPKLFRPFSQVDESTTRRYGGTGLGLAICRNLVELMGGAISVTSAAGQGSTFCFTIRAPATPAEPPPRNLAGVRVALVIPSPPLRRELVELIRGWHGDVVELERLGQLDEVRADVAVVEIDAEMARAFASRPEPPREFTPAKLFGLVPLSLSNDLRTALRSHFRLLVSKPVHHDAFFALLAGSWGSVPNLQLPTHFGFRVLVVETGPVGQRLVKRVLENLGCAVTMADSGAKAVSLLAERPADFDLVLLDLPLPSAYGSGVLREIRAGRVGSEVQSIWIIALTADAAGAERERGARDGCNDCLIKPLRLTDLEAALKKFRGHRAALKP